MAQQWCPDEVWLTRRAAAGVERAMAPSPVARAVTQIGLAEALQALPSLGLRVPPTALGMLVALPLPEPELPVPTLEEYAAAVAAHMRERGIR